MTSPLPAPPNDPHRIAIMKIVPIDLWYDSPAMQGYRDGIILPEVTHIAATRRRVPDSLLAEHKSFAKPVHAPTEEDPERHIYMPCPETEAEVVFIRQAWTTKPEPAKPPLPAG